MYASVNGVAAGDNNTYLDEIIKIERSIIVDNTTKFLGNNIRK